MARFATCCAVLVLILVLLPREAEAQGSPLDPDFGADGQVVTGVGRTPYQEAKAVEVLPDGSFLVLSLVFTKADYHPAIALSRFLPSGELDPSFGDGGTTVQWFPISDDTLVADLVVLPDGHILVAGWIIHIEGVVMRFRPDGQLDTTFGDEGIAYVGLESLRDIAAQGDGAFVILGHRSSPDYGMVVRRYDEHGALDPTFGTDGETLIPLGEGLAAWAEAFVVHPDGRIALSGWLSGASGLVVAQLLPDGSLDPSFGTEGITVTEVPVQFTRSSEIALQPDGKLVVAGGMSLDDTDSALFAVRYRTDGTLDPAFGTLGLVTVNPSALREGANSVGLQPDGDLILAGYSQADLDEGTHALVRLLPDGHIDQSFGQGGLALGPPGAMEAYDTRVLPDGRILTVGSTYDYNVSLTRHLADGSPDPTFGISDPAQGDGGFIEVGGLGPGADDTLGLWIQNDDRLLVVGVSEDWTGCAACVHVLRYTPDGNLDASYGERGIARLPDRTYANAHRLLHDDRLLVGAVSQDSVFLYMLTPDGLLDPTFGEGGRAHVSIPLAGEFLPSVVQRQPDGQILLTGTYSPGSTVLDRMFAVIRTDANGELDPSFGLNGMVTTDVGPSNEQPSAMVLLDDGRIVVGGSALLEHWMFALVAYRPDGTLDPSFGIDGIRTAAYGGERNIMGALARQGEYLFTFGGYSVPNTDTSHFLLARFSLSGERDTGFGWRRAFVQPGFARGTALAIQPDGRILAAGIKESPPLDYPYDYDFAVARFLPSGVPDPTFGANGEALISFGPEDEGAIGVGVLSTGRIVAAGITGDGFQTDYALAGFLPVTPTASEPGLNLPATPLALSRPAPNPASRRSTLSLTAPSPQVIRVTLTDMLGRDIAIVYDGPVSGTDPLVFDVATSDLPSGVYVLRVVGETMSASRTLTVVH